MKGSDEMSNTVYCPDCHGTKIYKAKNGDKWECEFCGGEGVVPEEEAVKRIEDWNSYRDMMRGYRNVER